METKTKVDLKGVTVWEVRMEIRWDGEDWDGTERSYCVGAYDYDEAIEKARTLALAETAEYIDEDTGKEFTDRIVEARLISIISTAFLEA